MVAASPLPSRGRKCGRNCYATPTCAEVPNAKHGEEIRSGCLTLAFSGAQKRVELLCNPVHSRGSPTPSAGGNQKWLPHPCLLGAPKKGENCYLNLAFSRVPNTNRGEEIRSGFLTPALSGAQKRAKLVCNPCILGGPRHQAQEEIKRSCLTHF